MNLGISGRRALVCAASRGLGRACAEELLAEGVHVTIVARDPARLAAAQAELVRGRPGAGIATIAADLATASGRRTVLEQCGPVDILITLCPRQPEIPMSVATRDDWAGALERLFWPPFELIERLAPAMVQAGFGRIINVLGAGLKAAKADTALSCGPRAAIIGLTAVLAKEVAHRGVSVNNVLPGPANTEGLAASWAHQAAGRQVSLHDLEQQKLRGTPSGRLARPSEVAAAVAFLASERAGFITGQSISVDGGTFQTLF